MHDPLDNPEVAAASRDRGGRSGPHGRSGGNPAGQTSTPRAANSRGVRVFALAHLEAKMSRACHHGRPLLPLPAPSWPTRLGAASLQPEGGFHV
jgi:hypothetical protein